MEWLDVRGRIEAGEGRHTELKRGLGDLSAVGKAICAFANTEGGVIILGVEPSGAIVGVQENTERVQERLTSFLQTGCSAPVSARVHRHQDPGGWVHWIEVPRQRGYEPLRYGGRVWIRREPSNVEPSQTELQELYNAFGYILTEERAIQAALPSDIDLQAFRSYLRTLGLETEAEPQPTTEDDLRNRGVLTELDGALHPTLYGVLAFGKEPHSARSSTGAGKGPARSGGQRRCAPRLRGHGSKVLLEVFSDRIDVTSPGLLPNHMTVESVRAGGHPRSRNELMANFLLVMGLMERGRGWPVTRQAMREFNGTDAELLQDEGGKFVRVRLRLSGDRIESEL